MARVLASLFRARNSFRKSTTAEWSSHRNRFDVAMVSMIPTIEITMMISMSVNPFRSSIRPSIIESSLRTRKA